MLLETPPDLLLDEHSITTATGVLLTVKQVAVRLHVCDATVYKLCATGRLPHVRMLNAVRVRESDLIQFIRTARR